MINHGLRYTELSDLSYVRPADGIRLLDMYLPDVDKPYPVLVFFHGGGLEGGERKGNNACVFQYLAEHGIAAVSADYRMYPKAVFPDYINDAATAVAYTVNYGKERGLFNRIYIGGSSAGAYLSMHLCFNQRYLFEAGINNHEIYGYIFDAGQPTVHFNVLRERGMDQRRICIDEAAALFYVNENFINSRFQPEMLFIIADDDIPCRYEQNQLMIKTLEQFGYNMTKIAFRLMRGYKHCSYISAQDPNGTFIYPAMIKQFICNGAAGFGQHK